MVSISIDGHEIWIYESDFFCKLLEVMKQIPFGKPAQTSKEIEREMKFYWYWSRVGSEGRDEGKKIETYPAESYYENYSTELW